MKPATLIPSSIVSEAKGQFCQLECTEQCCVMAVLAE